MDYNIIGEILIEMNILTDAQLNNAIMIKKHKKEKTFEEILTDEIGIDEEDILKVYAAHSGTIYKNNIEVNEHYEDLLYKIPREYSIKNILFPISEDEQSFTIAICCHPKDAKWKKDLKLLFRKLEINLILTKKNNIINAINEKYEIENEEDHDNYEKDEDLDFSSFQIGDNMEILVYSEKMQELTKDVMKVAKSEANVLFYGETGTGKELLTNLLHDCSFRKNKTFVKINCAALPETLVESELFGYEKGAFTGAAVRKIGKFEKANNGTIFLDEIGDINLSTQVKLLRVLQEKQIDRLGGNQPIDVDVRIIAATNKNLEQAVAEGKFRDDLFFRLNVISFTIPSLRERKEEIPYFIEYFIQVFNQKNKKNVKDVHPDVYKLLANYNWPGNIREIKNCIEHSVIFAENDMINVEHLPPYIKDIKINEHTRSRPETEKIKGKTENHKTENILKETEKEWIIDALKKAGYKKVKAAKILGIHRNTLFRKIKEFNIKI